MDWLDGAYEVVLAKIKNIQNLEIISAINISHYSRHTVNKPLFIIIITVKILQLIEKCQRPSRKTS